MGTQPFANDAAMDIFATLNPRSIALLLDVDGTLIDIGSAPSDVHVSDELRETLSRLLELTGGALALVSGRPIADLDRLFAPLKLPTIGGHGAEMRAHSGAATQAAEPLSRDLRRRLAEAATPGSRVGRRQRLFAGAALPQRGAAPGAPARHIEAARAAFPAEATEVLTGKSMFEVKRPNVSKGERVRTLMRLAPFAGRKPVFIGDDVTESRCSRGCRISAAWVSRSGGNLPE